MSRFWTAIVNTLDPYVPGEQPKDNNLIKLNTNENPYGPSPRVLEVLHHNVNDTLRLYPDPNTTALKSAIADYYHLAANQVFTGNGSDEVLAHIFQGLLNHDAPLLYPDITYSFYPVYCGLYNIKSDAIALNKSFNIEISDYNRPNGGIILPNPNAPTGLILPLSAIETLLINNPDSVLVVDEAYIDFGGETATPLIARYDNLLVVQTLSKSRALAGLRVGFAMGHPDLIEGLERVKNSFNSYPLDRLAISGAVQALKDNDYFNNCCAKIITSREYVSKELTAMGFEVLPSKANFVFVRHPHHDAANVFIKLRENNIIVRHFNHPRINQFLRISIGTQQDCETLVSSIRHIISQN